MVSGRRRSFDIENTNSSGEYKNEGGPDFQFENRIGFRQDRLWQGNEI
jgi:hypothetical protein